MPDLEAERGHLVKADDDIANGERRISAQLLLIGQLRAAGHEVGEAERLLLTLQQTLEAWQDHRTLIIDEIARLETMLPQ